MKMLQSKFSKTALSVVFYLSLMALAAAPNILTVSFFVAVVTFVVAEAFL
jgi:hypothetical protein